LCSSISALQASSPNDAARGVESTMSVKSMVVVIRSKGCELPCHEPLHLVDHRVGVVAQGNLVGAGYEHEPGPRDGLGYIPAEGGGHVDVVLQVDHQRRRRNERQEMPYVVLATQFRLCS